MFYKKIEGIFSFTLAILIAILAIVAMLLTRIFLTTIQGNVDHHDSVRALFLAESGLEYGTHALLTTTLNRVNGRIPCTELQDTFTPFGKNKGEFSIDGTLYYPSATLTHSISNTDNVIPVSSTAGFAPQGRLLLNREIIDYGGISGNSFTQAQRGKVFSTPAFHQTGSYLSQAQCHLTATGAMPNLLEYRGKKTLNQGIQLQEAWIIGDGAQSNITFLRWNPAFYGTQWQNASQFSDSTFNMNALSMLNYTMGWAVGDSTGNSKNQIFQIYQWNKNTWLPITNSQPKPPYIRNLYGISAVSTTEAWAVGQHSNHDGKNRQYTLLQWNGKQWCLLGPGDECGQITIPAGSAQNGDLFSVHVLDTTGNGSGNIGFAVGQNGNILLFNGKTWLTVPSSTTDDLYGVYLLSPKEAWAVGKMGKNGQILRWNGNSWSRVTTTTQPLQAIYMLDLDGDGLANIGWTVGENGVALFYNGHQWITQNIPTTRNLNSVAMYHPNDVWAVGDNGTILQWNGATWNAFESSGTQQNLNAISMIGSIAPKNMWIN